MKADTDAVGPDHNLSLTDTIAEANMIPTETVPVHTRGTVDAITEVLPGTHTPNSIHITLAKTPHIGDHLHTQALQLSQAGHDLDQHINQPGRLCTKILHDPGNPTVIHPVRETPDSQ